MTKQLRDTWVVYDAEGYPIYCASDSKMCHDHISDMVEHDCDGAAQCVVRKVLPESQLQLSYEEFMKADLWNEAQPQTILGANFGSAECNLVMQKVRRAFFAGRLNQEMQLALRYDTLHEYATSRGLDYNELCRAVRTAVPYVVKVDETSALKKPCQSPYCECQPGKCSCPGFYDARSANRFERKKPDDTEGGEW